MMSVVRPSRIQQHLGSLACLMALAALFLVIDAQQAFAQYSTFKEVQKGLASNFTSIPKLIAVIAYVIATFFAASGLLQLKEWVIDSDRNTLTAPLLRLAVASLLIYMPHLMSLTNNTLFSRDGGVASVDIKTPSHSLKAFEKK